MGYLNTFSGISLMNFGLNWKKLLKIAKHFHIYFWPISINKPSEKKRPAGEDTCEHKIRQSL